MRKYTIFALMLVFALISVGCGNQSVQPSDIADKTYVYEKDGFGGYFTITLNSDGTFQYYEGLLSSYIGKGSWELEGNTLTLSDDRSAINYFTVESGKLIFQEKNSSNFLHVTVSDGENLTFMAKLDETIGE